MTYRPSKPIIETWLARAREHSPIIIGIASCRRIRAAVVVLTLAVALLSHIHKHEQRCGKTENEQSLQKAIINIELQLVVVAVFAVVVQAIARHEFVLLVLFVHLCAEGGLFFLVVLDKSSDEFLQGSMRSHFCVGV